MLIFSDVCPGKRNANPTKVTLETHGNLHLKVILGLKVHAKRILSQSHAYSYNSKYFKIYTQLGRPSLIFPLSIPAVSIPPKQRSTWMTGTHLLEPQGDPASEV